MDVLSDTRSFEEMRKTETAFPEFYIDTVVDAQQSKALGHTVYKDVEMVRITPKGGGHNVPEKFVTEAEIRRFPEHYRAFKENREMEVQGTDLRNWPMATPAEVKNCRSIKIFSVEELAELNESGIQKLGMGSRNLVERAKAYIATINGGNTKIAADNTRMKSEIEELKQKLGARETELGQMNVRMAAMDAKLKILSEMGMSKETVNETQGQGEVLRDQWDAVGGHQV